MVAAPLPADKPREWHPRRGTGNGWGPWYWLAVLSCLCLVALPGCSGCRKTSTAAKKKAEEEAKKKKKKELPPYEMTQLTSYPDDPDQVQNFVKPGHWVTMTEQIRANNFDFQAEFELAATDRDGQPFLVEDTDFHLRLSRPVSLPKGQIRTLELTTYVPRVPRTGTGPVDSRHVYFDGKLRPARGGAQVSESRQQTTEMLDHQYFLVVLAKEPNSFRFLKVLDAISPPAHGEDGGRKYHYRVIIPAVSEFIPLPSHPLTWTSIAYLVWDDIDPNLLSTEQQQALLDWLHWGGQLIINGPGSLDLLKSSFLGPYLPAESAGSRDLALSDLEPLNEFWSLPSAKEGAESRRLELNRGRPLLGVQLKLRPEGRLVPHTGDLVCERSVGGGRIVVSALPLGDEALRNWKSVDNFCNGCLLRRPGRDFRLLADLDNDNAEPLWAGWDPGLASDSRLLSGIRFFTRDIGRLTSSSSSEPDSSTEEGAEAPGQGVVVPMTTSKSPPGVAPPSVLPPARSVAQAADRAGPKAPRWGQFDELGDYRFRGAATDRLSGVGGWNDDSGASVAVLETIKEAAGISIPEARFVLKMVTIYLIVLVPVNWLVFRLLGRVEWAWIAVPALALVAAVVVIRMAQLDIGFVRSRREVAVLELQGGYDRGHLTRYTLLYSSLSTQYDVTFADPSAVAQPFSKGVAPQAGMYASARSVNFRRDDQVRLRDFLVNSNSTELLHSEQMQPLGGPLELAGDPERGWQLHNHSELALTDVGLVWRLDDGTYSVAWLGKVAPRAQVPVQFAAAPDNVPWVPQWDVSAAFRRGSDRPTGEVNLSRFVELATRTMQLGPGDVRLIGWTAEELPGVSFAPVAAQNSARTVVVGHLRRGAWPEVARDANVRTDFYAPKPDPVSADEEGNSPP